MLKSGKRGCVLAFLVLFCAGTFASAATIERTFTDKEGRTMKAKLLSHKGNGTVDLEINGKTFAGVKISKFCLDDQEYLNKWVKANPPTIDYAFKYEIKPEKLSSDRSNRGYYRTRRAKYAYKVKVINASRDPVNDLTLKYQMFLHNETSGSYYSARDEILMKSGSFELPGEMTYNFSREFVTDSFMLEEFKYEGTNAYRRKDELAGILIRLYDKRGKLVATHQFGKHVKGLSWKEGGSKSKSSRSSRRSDDDG